MPSELAAPGANERELAARARGLKVIGVFADLVRLVRDHPGKGTLELLQRLYLPNVLGYAFLQRGLASGVLSRDAVGGWHAQAPDPVELMVPDGLDDFAADPTALPRQPALELLRTRREVTRETRALGIRERAGLGACLAASGATAVALDDDESVLQRWEPWGVHGLAGDVRLATGFPFGVFDLVTCPEDPDDRLLDTAFANLAIYGTLLTCLAGATHERMALVALLSRLESRFIVTDLCEKEGVFLLRAVKVPELRGEPDFLRHYVL